MKKVTIRIYADGAGAGPTNDQSKIAWHRVDTGEKHIEIIKAATNNEAEYLAVISASRIGKPDVEQCCGDLDYIVRNTNAGWLRPGLILLRGLWQDSLSIGNCEQQANCESR